MNFWGWPCEVFFSDCTFGIFASLALAIVMTMFIIVCYFILVLWYRDLKNEK